MKQYYIPTSFLLLVAAAWVPSLRAAGQCGEDTAIFEIQGATHVSVLQGQTVDTCGVVTATAFNGYYLQDAIGDGDDATSDGIFVLNSGEQPPVGSVLELRATVAEFIAGGVSSGNLSTTTLVDVEEVSIQGEAELPAPVLLGLDGRHPSSTVVISDSETLTDINLQLASDAAETPFNPDVDAIDFMESLEGMLVSVSNPVAVSGVRQFGRFSAEVVVLADRGALVEPVEALGERGVLFLQPDIDNRGDQNPERIQIQFDGTLYGSTDYPNIKVGDTLETITGVVGYSFGNYEVNALGPVTSVDGGLQAERSTLVGSPSDLLLASYNVLNLSAVEADAEQRQAIASQIVDSLNGPDIIALQEVQDNNGDIGDCSGDDTSDCAGVLDASDTLQALADAIEEQGGPAYAFVNVDPLVETTDDNRDDIDTFGGASLGNIRNAFLYNPERVTLLDHQGITREQLAERGSSVPDAFDTSRDPLEAVFEFNGRRITLLNNHFSSRFGSSPIFGGPQPFVQAGEEARAAQALAMHELVAAELDADPDARVVVLGDLNTFQFTDELSEVLPAASDSRLLHNLIETVPGGQAYSFNFEGNAQALDHVFVTDSLLQGAQADYVNVNVDFARLFDSVVASDHEPVLVRVDMSGAVQAETLALTGAVYSSTALELFWNYDDLQTSPVGVDILRDGVRIAGNDGRSFFQEGLSPDTVYHYEVSAFDARGDIVASGSISLQTAVGYPVAPAVQVASLTGLVYSSSALELFWQPPADSDEYYLYQVVRDGHLLETNDGRSFFDSGLQADTDYAYEVLTVDRQGMAGPAVSLSLKTNP
ncbi:endonuclease/exonuclease/phosphatase family protein [Granulosicoccus sp. 3-233]|uniref:endonuclease/exonuclease/phosphatase family protein n=1 Tax=Granulosicoccus sp. 3-233 TaxID=3417969 RepID=UPI003D351388